MKDDEDIIIDYTDILGSKAICIYRAQPPSSIYEIDEEDVNFDLIHQAINLLRENKQKEGIYKHNEIEWVEV